MNFEPSVLRFIIPFLLLVFSSAEPGFVANQAHAQTNPTKKTKKDKATPSTPQKSKKSGWSQKKLQQVLAPLGMPFLLPIKKAEKRYQKATKVAAKFSLGKLEKRLLKAVYSIRLEEGLKKKFRMHKLRKVTLDYIRRRGIRNYRTLAFKLLPAYEKSLVGYLASGAPVYTISVSLLRDKHLKLAKKLVRYAGFYPGMFQLLRFPKKLKALSAQQRYLIRTIFLVRWAKAAAGEFPLYVSMGKEFFHDYLRLRILYARKHKSRMWSAYELASKYKTFPIHRVFGWLFVQDNSFVFAKQSLKRALKANPKDGFARKLLDKLPK